MFTLKWVSYFWRDKNDNDASVSQDFILNERTNVAYHVLLLLWVQLLVLEERHASFPVSIPSMQLELSSGHGKGWTGAPAEFTT